MRLRSCTSLAPSRSVDEFSEAADYIGNIKLDDKQYGDLEDLVVNEHKDDGEAAIAEWLKANPDAYEGEITDEEK